MKRNDTLTKWYDGKGGLDGGPSYKREAKPENAVSIQQLDLLGGVRTREVIPADAHRKRTDLVAFNDGSPLMMALAGQANNAAAAQHALMANDSGRRNMQVGASAMAFSSGLDQQAGWRMGDEGGFTIDGSAAREHVSDVPLDQQAGWRLGDTSGISFGEGTYVPMKQTLSGMGRRVNPEIMPFNDGSQVMMQVANREQKARERYLHEEHRLVGGSAPLVQGVPQVKDDDKFAGNSGSRTDHFASHLGLDQQAVLRYKSLNDTNPWTLDGTIPAPGSPGARGRPAAGKDCNRVGTDVTYRGPTSWGVAPDMPEGHVPPNYAVNKSRWREGDTMAFAMDGAPADHPKRLHIDKHAVWRFGDTKPWAMDGAIDENGVEARRRAANDAGWRNLATVGNPDVAHPARHASDNGRKTTDIVFHKDPTMASSRHLSLQSSAFADTYSEIAGAIDPDTSAKNGGAIYGRGSSDVSRNAPTWGEVRLQAIQRELKASQSVGAMPTQAELYQAERLARVNRPADVQIPLHVYKQAASGLNRDPPAKVSPSKFATSKGPHGMTTSSSSGRLLVPKLDGSRLSYS